VEKRHDTDRQVIKKSDTVKVRDDSEGASSNESSRGRDRKARKPRN
jgi:hypothetical protein